MGQIQYSDKYFDDTYEYRYLKKSSFEFIKELDSGEIENRSHL